MAALSHAGAFDEVEDILLIHGGDEVCLVVDHERVGPRSQRLNRQMAVLGKVHPGDGGEALREITVEEQRPIFAQRAQLEHLGQQARGALTAQHGSGLTPNGPATA